MRSTAGTGDAAYAARFQTPQGNVGISLYGGIHLDNDNTSPINGADWSSQRWQIGPRDGNQLDISNGTPSNTNVSGANTILRITNTGDVGIGLAATDPSQKLHVNGTIRQTNVTNAITHADANGDLGALTVGSGLSLLGSTLSATGGGGGGITGQYEKYILQQSVSASSGVTVLLSFGGTGLLATYNTGAITDWVERSNYIEITTDGVYQFTFGALIATFGGSQNDMRQTISTNLGLGGEILSFRNRTRITDRATNTGISTAFLLAGDRVYFSVFSAGQSWEVAGIIPPEVRTFIDIRRVE